MITSARARLQMNMLVTLRILRNMTRYITSKLPVTASNDVNMQRMMKKTLRLEGNLNSSTLDMVSLKKLYSFIVRHLKPVTSQKSILCNISSASNALFVTTSHFTQCTESNYCRNMTLNMLPPCRKSGIEKLYFYFTFTAGD